MKVQLKVPYATATTIEQRCTKTIEHTNHKTTHLVRLKQQGYTRDHKKSQFEIKLNDHNLKEGRQSYTVTRTFVPDR